MKNEIGEVYSLECTKVPKVFFVPLALLNVSMLLLVTKTLKKHIILTAEKTSGLTLLNVVFLSVYKNSNN
jgi:hypothetical protein